MMYKINKLALIAGIPIAIPSLGVSVHQPVLKEIAYLGEQDFYEAAQYLTVKGKDIAQRLENLTEEDKNAISQLSNFEVFLKLVEASDLSRAKVEMLFALLFPEYTVSIEDRFIMLLNPAVGRTVMINEENFEELQFVISTILCLQSSNNKDDFNPVGDKAREIAEKLRRGREKVARLKGQDSNQESDFLSKYISGLGIGTNSLNIRDVLELTLYQLFDQLERYSLFMSYNIAIKAKMAGAEGVEDVDWLKNIH